MNILGGYRFPDAPGIDLRPTELVSAPTMTVRATDPAADLIAAIPDDLSIPPFLDRRIQPQLELREAA